MPEQPEPSGADAVVVVACLLIVLTCFIALMCDFAAMVLRETLARLMFRG